jgi:chaperone modulatory protein CbpM
MPAKEFTVITIEPEDELTLQELCDACQRSSDFIDELIEYGAIQPRGFSIATWRFDAKQLQRIQRMLRLQEDLEVNLAGAVLAVDLMEKIDALETEVEILKKHLTHFNK